jgi:hypothetical protein
MRKLRKLTNEEEKEIFEKRNNGAKIKDLMNEYSIKSSTTVYKAIERNGRDRIVANKKYDVDDSFFEKIDSEEKAYWLGFLYADGYVRIKKNAGELKLKLNIKDRNHIELFRKSIKSTHKIIDSTSKVIVNGKEHTSLCSTLSIYNTKIVSDLFKLGCLNNKTFKIRMPNIEDEFIRHFIRGYFDGDGCISLSKKSNSANCLITSNFDFLSDLLTILNFGKLNKRGNIFDLVFYSKKNIKNFYELLYNNSTIFLERKYLIFKQHLFE